ncbi:MAG TPA: BamA/TamA family outer membrane protein [Longimicrobiaceae bacterium]|nr:BamA/TamA family outer membrane protein [Longimicrobiaceae bacterium]
MTAPRSPASRLLSSLLLALAVAAADAAPLDAQYFGRNRVQYEDFDFRVLRTENFDVYYYPEEEVAVRDAARMAERWYERLARIIDHRFEDRQPLVLYASHPHFQQTTTTGSEIGEGTGGFTEAFKRRVVMPLAGSYEETDHVLGHEMVHAFQYDIAGFGRAGAGQLEAAARRLSVPLWFTEGMAEYLSVGPVDPNTAMWVRDAALSGDIPTVEQMTFSPRYFPYRWGQAFWAYVGGRWGDAVVGQILKQVGQGVPYEEAFERILNTSLDEISEDWHTAIRRAYLPLLAERREAREIARPLITRRGEGGRINLAPSVSPDGRWVAFLSELEFLDVELYLANAETGEIVRRLQRGTAFDPHFGSLRYINSAGTWSPTGDRFAFSALRKGRDVLVVIDVPGGRRLREYAVPGVSEITNPSWSPDGQTIAFSGTRGGLTDLWVLDVRTGRARQLTNDRYADLQPSYSPDGRTIAFVTDRGGDTDFSTLEFGSYRIALMDVASGEIRPVPAMETGPASGRETWAKNINPSWSSDGGSLYFISNRLGISNIYRVELATGALSRVTDLFTGVSGITDLSPALSTARTSNRLLFTAFERGGYNIYSLSEPAELAGVAVADTVPSAGGVPLAAFLPPVPRPTEPAFNRVMAMLGDQTTGLPTPDTTWAVRDYRPRLSLDYLGQPQVGVSTGSAFTGGGVYGGIAAIFSDVLGHHQVFGAVQAQGQIDEIGFSTVYLNRKRRWNFGTAAQRIPYIALAYQPARFDPTDSRIKEQLIRLRFFDTSLQGLAQYPFSQVQRVEFSAGVRRMSRDAQVQEVSAPAEIVNGQVVLVGNPEFRQFEDDRFETAYNMVEGSAALVYDNSLLGYTSPFAGQRYRFEVTPTVGTLQFAQALADYRRYLFFRPFTLAFRGFHFGRYGRDAEQNELFNPIYLGQPFLMRGYGDAFNRCFNGQINNRSDDCRVANRLFGSRVAVANAELRFPLIRQLVLGSSFGLPPVEGFAFFDAGTVWDQNSEVVFERRILSDVTERGIVTSAGVGGRINLFGYLILEIDYVNGFERDRGWHWQFALQPGF